jgi:nucleotide-binding universal stress UspA family protein
MKKILIVFDGPHYSEGALEFARVLNTKEPVLLTGAFLPQVDYANLWSYAVGGMAGALFIPLMEDEDAENIKQNITRFENYCNNNKIAYSVHKDFLGFAFPELKKESRFADLLVISSERFYEQMGGGKPNEYLQQALHEVECPVVVIPEKFDFPNSTILSYDGSEASTFAIKQFAYLFPEFREHPTTLFYEYERGKDTLPDELKIRELATRHFKNLSFIKLESTSNGFFSKWLSEEKEAIVVSGAFGRSDFSRMLHKSFVTDVIQEHKLPVFVAHK